MSLSPAEQRALLRRIEDAATTPADALLVETLFDATSHANLIKAIREMTAAMTESTTAEHATATELATWRDRLTKLLDRLAAAEEERNRLRDEELQIAKGELEANGVLATTAAAEDAKTRRVTIERVAAVVLGLLGLVGTVAGYYFGAAS